MKNNNSAAYNFAENIEHFTTKSRLIPIILATLIVAATFVLILLVFLPNTPSPHFVILGTFLLASVFLWEQYERGRIELATKGIIFLLWAVVTTEVLAFGGLYTPAFGAYTVVIIIASLLGTLRIAILVTAFAVSITFILTLESYLGLNINQSSYPIEAYLIAYITYLPICTLIIRFIVDKWHTNIMHLSQNRNSWKALIDQTQDFIAFIDLELRVGYLNHAIQGVDRTAEIGKSVFALVPSDYQEHLEKAIDAVRKTLVPRNVEVAGAITRRSYQINISPMQLDETLVGYILISKDVTDHRDEQARQFNAHLQNEKQRIFKEIMSNMSHDLRTPLTIVQNHLYILEQDIVSDQAKLSLSSMKRQTEHLERLIAGFLDMSRLDMADKHKFSEINVASLIIDIMGHYEARAGWRSVSLSAEIEHDLPFIQGSHDELYRLITNVIDNAVKFTMEDGSITIHAVKKDDTIQIEVTDNGMGIEDDALPHIFDRFYRVGAASDAMMAGSGLGLTIAHKIVERHDGTIAIKSAPGQGTTVTIILPQKA